MNRTAAAVLAALAALAALTLAVTLTLASGRCMAPSADVPHMTVHGTVAAGTVAAGPGQERCVRGAGAAATAVGGTVFVGGRVDVERLAEVSRVAFAIEREAERRGAAPAWPQRMGLDAAGAPVAPPPTCVVLSP